MLGLRAFTLFFLLARARTKKMKKDWDFYRSGDRQNHITSHVTTEPQILTAKAAGSPALAAPQIPEKNLGRSVGDFQPTDREKNAVFLPKNRNFF